MNNMEKRDIWKKRLIELKEKVRKLNYDKSILISIVDELNKNINIKLNNILYDIDLQKEISYLNDWVEFYLKYTEKYELRIKKLDQTSKEGTEKAAEEESKRETELFKFIFKEAEEKPIGKTIKERIKEYTKKPLIKYGIAFIILLLIILGLFFLKPSFTGYVAFGKETTYNENLNLKINESGSYKWELNKSGEIKSIKATGSVSGNGTVKVYIEKDGKGYLIYKNRQ